MKVTKEKLENSLVRLKIEVEPQEKEAYLDKAYRRVVNKVMVPGFRRGKAPRAVLERHIGKEALLQEAIEQLVPDMCRKAIEEQGVEAISEPDIQMSSAEPIIFQATVPVRPTVELGDYRSIRIPIEPVVVTEEDISRYLENIRERNALWEPVARPLQVGDRITIDLQGTVEGKEIIKEEDLQLVMAEGAQIITPGFSEKLVGMSAGEEKEFQLPFPTDFRAKDVAGKECLFKVKLKDIKEKKLPELDDDLAKSLGEGLETLEALKTKIRSDLQQVRENLNRRKHEAGVLEAVVASSKVEYPDILVEREIDRIVDEKVRLSGLDNLERYLQNIKKSAEEIREEQREEAKKRVINAIILEKIGELEKVEVAEADIDKEIENIVKVNAGPKEETSQGLNTPTMRESIRNVLRQRKTLRLLSDIALSPETAAKQEN